MEIKDITLSAERLDEVRGGQYIGVTNLGLQVGGNQAASHAASYGIGNTTSSGVSQVASQSFAQSTAIQASEVDSFVSTIDSSILGFGGLLPK